MKMMITLLTALSMLSLCCQNSDDTVFPNSPTNIEGYGLLSKLTGHWVGSNETAFGDYDWFAFDFRPISASHVHSIYEGGTNQNIITSVFIADFEGKQQIMARNGGWLGNQYRATYFVLDRAEETDDRSYYRLVDAVGREKRAYMELRFENDTLYFDAYKDNSGSLDEPVHHMGFKGTNYNPDYAQTAIDLFDFPQPISEVDLNNKFTNLIDDDSALFLEESDDPFPKQAHGHVSDLKINIERADSIQNDRLLLYMSTAPIIDENGQADFENVDKKVVRTIDIFSNELFYETTYLHPDTYFVTAFSDTDENYYPSSGDTGNVSTMIEVTPESQLQMNITVDKSIE